MSASPTKARQAGWPTPIMKTLLRFAVLPSLLALLASGLIAQAPVPQSRRIAIFGSSVASGTGDETSGEGYAGRLRALVAPRGWEVLNQSRGGDSTLTAAPRFAPVGEPQPNTKYLLPVNPAYVVIGLSLGNEGIKNQSDTAGRDAIYRQFETGILGFIQRSRENRIVPIVANCYARQDFTETEYGYTKRMNLLINSWDVPSINFLGAVDDGTGKWAKGFIHDALHPNHSGHLEMATAFVPSLFEALEQGKPRPTRPATTAFARATGGNATLTFSPAEKMHPFTLGVSARAQADGVITTLTGSTLTAATYYLVTAGGAAGRAGNAATPTTLSPAQLGAINAFDARLPEGSQTVANARTELTRASLTDPASLNARATALGAAELALALARAEALAATQSGANRLTASQLAPVVTAAGRGASLQTFGRGGGAGGGLVEETALNPNANFTATVGVKNGVWTYTSADGTAVASTVRADGNWHNLVVSHYTARGETLFYVDGRLAGRTTERLEPKSFRLGGAAGTTPVDLRDALLYRSALNEDEVAALQSGTLLQSSLEIYAPLADATFTPGAPVENRAQSLTAFTAGMGLAHLAQ
jgi:lysophospholipase L1-like esterase